MIVENGSGEVFVDVHIEILVEEPSAEVALVNLVPKIIHKNATFLIHSHQGKADLLKKLPNRLLGYKRWIPADWRIVVLIDGDREDCKILKKRMEEVAEKVGFVTKSMAGNTFNFTVLNRLAMEELEAWFFGDMEAVREAYPRTPVSISNKKRYRDPDKIQGGTWEALERELKRAGYFRAGISKITAAREISSHMEPERNRSKSFQMFYHGLLNLIGLEANPGL